MLVSRRHVTAGELDPIDRISVQSPPQFKAACRGPAAARLLCLTAKLEEPAVESHDVAVRQKARQTGDEPLDGASVRRPDRKRRPRRERLEP
ncbi:MAG TPA: hypothetical protein VOA80_14400, partial [Thermoanaerobaculia bacterium]|nr:hypothetical protein [Thermoanaerobaculia bacterium]